MQTPSSGECHRVVGGAAAEDFSLMSLAFLASKEFFLPAVAWIPRSILRRSGVQC